MFQFRGKKIIKCTSSRDNEFGIIGYIIAYVSLLCTRKLGTLSQDMFSRLEKQRYFFAGCDYYGTDY